MLIKWLINFKNISWTSYYYQMLDKTTCFLKSLNKDPKVALWEELNKKRTNYGYKPISYSKWMASYNRDLKRTELLNREWDKSQYNRDMDPKYHFEHTNLHNKDRHS